MGDVYKRQVLNLCGGCQLLDMEYAKQLAFKQKQAEELLKGLCPVKPIIGMKDPFHYRNKVHAVFDRDKRGNIISGIYEENGVSGGGGLVLSLIHIF